jgi:hypothetical protein
MDSGDYVLTCGMMSENPPQSMDVDINLVVLHFGIMCPDCGTDRRAAEHLPRVLHKVAEQTVLEVGQAEFLAAYPQPESRRLVFDAASEDKAHVLDWSALGNPRNDHE